MLFDSPVFGPVHSRRLGVSLGVNLLPARAKVCSFDCIYCECGYNRDTRVNHANAQSAEAAGMRLPTREQVRLALEAKLTDMAAHGRNPTSSLSPATASLRSIRLSPASSPTPFRCATASAPRPRFRC